MTVTTPAGFRAHGVAAGLKSTGAKDVALVVNDGPTFDSASVFTANRCLANPVLWSKEVVKDGVVQRRRPQLRRRQLLHRPRGLPDDARRRRAGRGEGRHRRDRRGRLLDRPDRARQRPGRPARRCRRGVRRPVGRRGTAGRRGDHDHRLGAASRPSSRAPAGPSAGWPRAPGCWRRSSPRCSSSSPPTPSSRPPTSTPRCARRPGSASTGSTPTAACRPTTR